MTWVWSKGQWKKARWGDRAWLTCSPSCRVWGFIRRTIRNPQEFMSKGIAIISGKLYFEEYVTSPSLNMSSEYLHVVYGNSSNAHSLFHLVCHVNSRVVFLTCFLLPDLSLSTGQLIGKINRTLFLFLMCSLGIMSFRCCMSPFSEIWHPWRLFLPLCLRSPNSDAKYRIS